MDSKFFLSDFKLLRFLWKILPSFLTWIWRAILITKFLFLYLIVDDDFFFFEVTKFINRKSFGSFVLYDFMGLVGPTLSNRVGTIKSLWYGGHGFGLLLRGIDSLSTQISMRDFLGSLSSTGKIICLLIKRKKTP